jgi:hypothetical protein
MLIEEVADLPQLSSGLRERVLVGVRRGIVRRRVTDAVRVALATVVAGLLVAAVWTFRTDDAPDVAREPAQAQPAAAPEAEWGPHISPGSMPLVQPDSEAPRQAAPGPGGSSEDRSDMRQINQLIEDLNNRRNHLCSILPLL